MSPWFYNIIGFGGRALPAPVAELDRWKTSAMQPFAASGDQSTPKMKSYKHLLRVTAAFGVLFALLHSASALTWIACTNAPNKTWWSVASSADGTKLVAAAYGSGIYTSTNSGLTWISNNAPARNWYSVASSADGKKLVAVINVLSTSGAGGIYSSTNGGDSWWLTTAPASLHS